MGESEKFKRDQKYLQRAPHLRPVYYRILLTTRPFGLALCKTFDEKYLCVVLPELPSGQLGLRAGSEILSINSFAQKSEVINVLNEQYPHQKQHNFIWMYQFPKVQYLQDNTVMPITLYLKFDPLVVLSENTEKVLTQKQDQKESNDDEKNSNKDKDKEQCNYWKLLQDDIYRWAVVQKSKLWQVCQPCDVYTMPAIQSPIIENNIIDYYHSKANKQIIQKRLNKKDKETVENELKTMSDFVVEDEFYKKIGTVESGIKLKIYSKAGSYLEIREPMNGWVKFKNVGKRDYCIKCKQQDIENNKGMEEKDERKVIGKDDGDFTLFVTKNYLENLGVYDAIKPVLEKKEEKNESADDAEYNIIDIVDGLNAKCGDDRVSILYFMGDVDFGYTFDAQQKHLKQLMNLCEKFKSLAHFIVIRVCCIDNNMKSKKVSERLMIENKEMNGCVYGRSRIEILKKYGLLNYDTGFFKYGLMLLSKTKEIVIHPRDNIDDIQLGIFQKVASHIISSK